MKKFKGQKNTPFAQNANSVQTRWTLFIIKEIVEVTRNMHTNLSRQNVKSV